MPNRLVTLNGPDPIDRHVGQRLRALRRAKGLSQSQLAALCELSFQQIQKYEHGDNRISASRLYRLALALDVSITALFEGLEATGTADGPG